MVEKGTKTASSSAELKLSTAAVQALRVWKLRQDMERQEWGAAWADTGYIVTMENGVPVDPEYLSKLLGKLVVKTEQDKRAEFGAHIASALRQERPDLSDREIARRVDERWTRPGSRYPG